jgi:hypothetical protein
MELPLHLNWSALRTYTLLQDRAAPPRPPIATNRAWSPSSLLRSSRSRQAHASRTVAPALTTGGSGVNALDQVL